MEAIMDSARTGTASADVQKTVLSSLEMLDGLYEYNHAAYAKIRPYLKGSVCEIGCGIGNVIQFLLNHERVVGIEPFADSIRKARRRFAEHKNVSFVESWLSECPNEQVPAQSFDSVICLRVLESIEDDQEALSRMCALSKPGGSVVILVAAHQSAYGTLDEVYGHLRRYNRRHLASMFSRAGLKVTHSFHTNAPGYFGWLWHSRIRRSRSIPASAARMSNWLVPFLDAFERCIRLPFGQSLIMVGTPTKESGAF